ncbi:hypothetical protein PR048_000355 [Dryococelus australis]|uniref:Retrovirus-related Pol polyprotein from transposon TNT 1-94 n=1 Tax=Dryococelus australis TaxID=614101 RepID=A0ABQ9IEC8_9NEOP|nr:hypothetical protein PR048_000355 [Dryococelus australis]
MSNKEPCVFIKKSGNKLVVIALYVDDSLIFRNGKLCYRYEHRTGWWKNFLESRTVQENILCKYNISSCKLVSTPLEPGSRLRKPEKGEFLKKSLIGSLMYLAVCTRPDITHSVNYLSQFNNCYTLEHWKAAKRILRYLKGTKQLKLEFKA